MNRPPASLTRQMNNQRREIADAALIAFVNFTPTAVPAVPAVPAPVIDKPTRSAIMAGLFAIHARIEMCKDEAAWNRIDFAMATDVEESNRLFEAVARIVSEIDGLKCVARGLMRSADAL